MAQGSRYITSDPTAPYRGYTTAGNTNNALRDAHTPEINEDLKNIDFNALVRQLNPALQAEYLTKIEYFLKYESECGFPGIPPSLHMFLENIATDHDYLLSWEFDFTCNKICTDIVEITQRNEKIYDWVCFYKYEYGQNVLKYKKVFHPIHMKENHKTITLTNQNSNVGYSSPCTPPLPHNYMANNNIIEEERKPYTNYEKISDTYQSSECVKLTPTAQPMCNLTQQQKRMVRIIQSVREEFIVTALKKYLDFLKDDNRPTLQFERVSAKDAEFLLKINKFHTFRVNDTFSKEAQALAKQLMAMVVNKKKKYKGVTVVEKKINKQLRNVIITKKKDKIKREEITQTERMRKGDAAHKLDSEINKALSDMAIVYNPREMFLKALGKHNETTVKDMKKDSTSSDNINSKESSTFTTKDKRNKEDRNLSTQPSIQWQSAGNMYDDNDIKNKDTVNKSDTVNSSDTVNRSDIRSKGDKRSKDRDARRTRGHKIIEALSQPIESERAVRMMKLMGWSGGALGVRGEGITEPIMPALDLKSGAGFGHLSPTRVPRDGRERRDRRESRGRRRDRSPLQYRIRILDSLWELLEGGEDSLQCQFQSPLQIRELRFIRNCVGAFNGRNNVGLNSEQEKLLVANIRHYMNTHLDLNIDYTLDDAKCSVTLLKTTRVILSRKSKLEKHNIFIDTHNSDDSDDENTKTTLIKTTQVEDILRELKKNINTEKNDKKSRRNRIVPLDMKSAYKIMFLKNIQSFLRSADLKTHFMYQDNITAKQCRWIENIIMNCNRRERARYNTKKENELYSEIRNYIDCKLKISFGRDARTMTLKKEYRTTRDSAKTNQSKDESKKVDTKVENKIYVSDSDEETKVNHHRDKYKRFSDSISDCDTDLSIDDLLVIDDCDEDSKSIAETVKESITLDENSKENKVLERTDTENIKLESTSKENNLPIEPKSEKPSSELIEENIKEIEKLLQNEDPLQIKVQISLINDSSKNDDIVVISDDIASNTSVASKRSRIDSDSSLTEVILPKKPRIDKEITVAIVTDNDKSINKSIATLIQDAILKSIDKINIEDLPSLKCHGIIDKTLQYTCFDEKSHEFIKKTIENVSSDECRLKLIVLNEPRKVIRKLSLRLNSFLNEHPVNILKRFKKYYKELNTDVWDVIFEHKHEDFLLLTLVVDENSYKVIVDNNFCLHNGIDRAEFSVIWS